MELEALDAADRGFLTWLAGMLREPLADLWRELADSDTAVTDADRGHQRLRILDLRPIGQRLRWAVGADRRLGLPLAGLDGLERFDASGLLLDVLDLAGLPSLRELNCDDNQLRELELGSAERLEHLQCAGNELMVLDLRGLGKLKSLNASGNRIAAVMLEGCDALTDVDLSRNQLMVLDVPALPFLASLYLTRNALVHFGIPEGSALRRLDVARNDLDALSLGSQPSLVALRCDRNRLSALPLSGTPALETLDCFANYLTELDLAHAHELTSINARGNQLETVHIGTAPNLAFVDVADNRLTDLEIAQCEGVTRLLCAGNRLSSLNVRGLCQMGLLHASENDLTTLDLTDALHLAELRVDGNKLEELDITHCAELVRFASEGVDGRQIPRLRSTPFQRHRLVELRRLYGLNSGRTGLGDMTVFELHDRAIASQGRQNDDDVLLEIVKQPHCDLGTAMLVYWISAPSYYQRHADRAACEPYEQLGFDILATVEDRIANNSFLTAQIWFDPRCDKQTSTVTGMDWTRRATRTDAPVVRPIPARLFEPSILRD